MINQNNKIQLIYISSNGRSGSTLLDMLTGRHKNCFTLGEFQMLPIDYLHNTQPCGCGKRVDHCIFWSDVIKKNQEIINSNNISKFRNFGGGKVLRWTELIEIFFNISTSNLQEITKYGENNHKILSTILEKIGKTKKTLYLVDASKDPYRLKWLAQSGYFDIKVLHIVKTPESFVFSMTKNEKSFFKKLNKTIRMSIRWIVENIIIMKVTKKFINKENYKKIKYEELASNVNKQLKFIHKFLDLEKDDFFDEKFIYPNHAISGNLMRFKINKISLDEKWKSDMTAISKNICRFITAPFEKIYK